MEKYTVEDKVAIICFKNQLINGSLDMLKKIYSDHDSYGYFIDLLNITLDTEPAFFLIDEEVLEKAEHILYSKRFDYKDHDYIEVINEIIGSLNSLRNMDLSMRNQRKNSYLLFQEQTRRVAFRKHEQLMAALAYDGEVINFLQKNNGIRENTELYLVSSANYFARAFPEYYEANPDAQALIMQQLDEMSRARGIMNIPFRMAAKDAKKNVEKVYKKGE